MDYESRPGAQAAPIQRQIASRTDQLVEQLLHSGRIASPKWWLSQRARIALFSVGLAGCGVISVAYAFWYDDRTRSGAVPSSFDVGSLLVIGLTSVFVYLQWTDGRREQSIDRFYDRLSLINTRYYDWPEARALVGHFWGIPADEGAFRRRMYVYLEIDNIEYIALRYELGFVTKDLLRRSIRTFSSRCESSDFADLAVDLVNGAGYRESTVAIVKALTEGRPPTPANMEMPQ